MNFGYCYFASCGIKQGYQGSISYGPKCEIGNVITMTVDLEKYQIKYKINDMDIGSAFDNIEQKSYRVGLYLYYNGVKVQIIR